MFFYRTAQDVEEIVRNAGAVPATVAVLNHKLCVGEGISISLDQCSSMYNAMSLLDACRMPAKFITYNSVPVLNCDNFCSHLYF